MKDNLSLIAAAAGGFMLAIAASGIIHAAPITSSNIPPLNPTPNLQPSSVSRQERLCRGTRQCNWLLRASVVR